MPRSVILDVTHLRHNIARDIRSGIRRVDLEYADHFLNRRGRTLGLQYGVWGPALVDPHPNLAGEVTAAKARLARGERGTALFAAVVGWLGGQPFRAAATPPRPAPDRRNEAESYLRFLTPPSRLDLRRVPSGAVYLNVAQHALHCGFFFSWLDRRPDVRPVFFVHDLLPLDQPEFWRAGYLERFEAGVGMMARRAAAFLTSTHVVAERLNAELAKRGRHGVPVCAVPLPAMLDEPSGVETVPTLRAVPYFVMLGTIEPRKNHLLILQLWQAMVARGGPVPKLVVAGTRGWENEQVVALLDRCAALRPHVIEAPALVDRDLRVLIANARGLLFPSFGEGFGLPLTEALGMGTPVIASDLPVMREAADGRALFIDPLDGPGWLQAIAALADPDDALAVRARQQASSYRALGLPDYFQRIEAFLDAV